MDSHKVKFKVSFSNGETFYEGKGKFVEIEGEKSPAQRMFDYQDENELDITSMSLYLSNGQEFHLPSRGKNPKFRAFDEATKPLDYNVFRKIARNVSLSGEVQQADHFTCIESIYEDHSVQLWVDEQAPHSSYVLMKGTK